MRRAFLLLVAASLGGCMVGPNYRAPKVTSPAAFGEAAAAPGANAQDADLSHWWRQLGDPELDSLIGRALTQNLDVKTAASRLSEAREQVVVARSGLFPTVSGSAIAARRDAQSGSSGAPPASAATGGGTTGAAAGGLSLPKHIDVYSLGADASWMVDIFGGTRRGIESAEAQAEVAHWQARDAQIALASEVAKTYVTLRMA